MRCVRRSTVPYAVNRLGAAIVVRITEACGLFPRNYVIHMSEVKVLHETESFCINQRDEFAANRGVDDGFELAQPHLRTSLYVHYLHEPVPQALSAMTFGMVALRSFVGSQSSPA